MPDDLDDFAQELRDLAEDAGDAADRIPEAMEDGVKNTAGLMMMEMKKNAPVGESGDLVESINYESTLVTDSKVTYEVGPRHHVCDYAEYVEYGTGSKGERGGSSYYITPDGLDPQEALAAQQAGDFERVRELAEEYGALAWDGADHPVLVVEHPGIESQAFFRPAVKKAIEKDWLVRNLDEATDDVIRAEMKR